MDTATESGPVIPTPPPRLANIAALISVAVVVGEWGTKTVAAYHHGILSTDSLWYHLPLRGAVRPRRIYYATALCGLRTRDRVLSCVIGAVPLIRNAGDGNRRLVTTTQHVVAGPGSFGVMVHRETFRRGAHRRGRKHAILFATPGLVGTQPGGAYDDVVGLALLLSSIALLIGAQGLTKRSGEAAWLLAAARVRDSHWAPNTHLLGRLPR